MSFYEVEKHHQAQSSGSAKKKRKRAYYGEVYEALKMSSHVLPSAIEKVSSHLSHAIGEAITDKHMQLGEKLEKTITRTILERHKVAK